jgi:hypothetical protein
VGGDDSGIPGALTRLKCSIISVSFVVAAAMSRRMSDSSRVRRLMVGRSSRLGAGGDGGDGVLSLALTVGVDWTLRSK